MARVRVGANWLARTLQPARAEAAGRAVVMAVAGSAKVAKVAEVRVVAPTAEGGGMATTLAAGFGVAAAALVARQGVTLWAARAAAPAARKFYEGGFEGTMTRREAALILVRAPRQREEGGGGCCPPPGSPRARAGPRPLRPPGAPSPTRPPPAPSPPPPLAQLLSGLGEGSLPCGADGRRRRACARARNRRR